MSYLFGGIIVLNYNSTKHNDPLGTDFGGSARNALITCSSTVFQDSILRCATLIKFVIDSFLIDIPFQF